MPNSTPPIDPSPILQTAFAFWSSKALLTGLSGETALVDFPEGAIDIDRPADWLAQL